MTAISPEITLPRPRVRPNPLAPLATLAARRFQLSVRTPRELVVPLLTPILFALVIAPALKQALHTSATYEAFVATGTIGLCGGQLPAQTSCAMPSGALPPGIYNLIAIYNGTDSNVTLHAAALSAA